MSIAYILDHCFAEHRPLRDHPERPERIIAVHEALRAAGLAQRGAALPLRAATEDELGRVHSAAYVADLIRLVPGKSGWLDGDTYFSPGTWDVVLAAAGASIDATQAVLSGQFERSMVMVRPPGHHAEADCAMGFCLLNNVAIAAAAARDAGARRVAIVDWDVHHGNGTQHIFAADPDVLFLSCHQYPFYPGTGAPGEVGIGPGVGATVNVALPAGVGDAEYQAVFEEVFAPALRRFRPDIVLISAGFDAYVDDRIAGMRVTRHGFHKLAWRLRHLADTLCEGRLVCILEGGYDLDGLGQCVVAVLDAFDAPSAPDGVLAEGRASGPTPAAIMAPARAAIAATKQALHAAGKPLP